MAKKMSEFNAMTDEELRELSLQKNKKGNATSDALTAQRILWARSGCGFNQRGGIISVGSGNTCSKHYAYKERHF